MKQCCNPDEVIFYVLRTRPETDPLVVSFDLRYIPEVRYGQDQEQNQEAKTTKAPDLETADLTTVELDAVNGGTRITEKYNVFLALEGN